jgi:hypothetical protein
MDEQLGPVPNPTPAAAPAPSALGDWPVRAADLVETLVVVLRDKTVRPLSLVARAVVFGIIVFAAAVSVITLLSIALIRLLTVYAFNGRVWASDLLVGAVFVIIGLVAWSQRTQRHPESAT